jgi:hypothetical protein
MGAPIGVGTAYPPGEPSFILVFSGGRVCLFVFILSAIVLFILRIAVFYCPFGVFKLFSAIMDEFI